ncbi:thyroid receptor-interacting protein 6-like [Acipenser oxyrinchus oxyrinchus]|uniref:Thyroid receptor-interacting protein 6-like n=1 Tax=Acipenser oxyrinchus oxyrinchus TaxID=40147 RepID=A0AAD8CLA3_ACIOX|nr:thyroid receptor-interacting protein 6-like [Acipenser oxyrinchus oxyrinchus]
MSVPTWLPPRTLGSPERSGVSISASGPPAYKPPKKVAVATTPKYGAYDQNGGPGVGVATRYQATGPTGGMPLPHVHAEDSGTGGFLSPMSGDHYYPSPPAAKEEKASWNHPVTFDLQPPGSHPSNIDAEIDSLTSMLADMESTPPYPRTPRAQPADRYKPTAPPGGQPKPAPSYHHPPQNQQALSQHQPHYATAPVTYSSPPASSYPPSPNAQPYTPSPAQQSYSYPSQGSKPYPQPVPASYTTASTPPGPRFSVQVQTAQPVRSYSQTGRPAEQAYAPPSPRQHPEPPYRERAPYPDSGQGWYPAPPLPSEAASSLPDGSNQGYRGFAAAPPGPRPYQPSAGGPKRGQEAVPPAATPQTAGYPRNQVPVNRPEDELDRLTKKLVYDMNHPPTDQYFGRCARCGDNVLGDGTGCIAMDQVFHVECFTCITCQCRLRGQPFYAIEKKSYCENCYISTLERCSKCSQPILDRILRAMGKAYHPHCFTCVVCSRCLDGVPFTVDATSQIHCIEDFHRKFAPRCSVCGKAIMPERGQEETVRIVALDRSFHVNCYMCEDCGSLLSSEGEGRGCYPLDGHILCKGCSARRIQDLSAKISTDC